MGSAQRWLRMLAVAGLPAFLYRQDSTGLSVVGRTPDYLRVLQAVSIDLDEPALLGRLSAPRDGAVVEVMPGWGCAVRAFDDDVFVAVLRLPPGFDAHHDMFYTMVENLPDIVTRHNRNYQFVYGNPAFDKVSEMAPEQYLGRTHHDIGVPEQFADEFQASMGSVLDTGVAADTDFSYPGPGGRRHYASRAVAEYNRDGTVDTVLSVIRDITELKRLQQQLERLAGTDALTALPNRRSFFDNVSASLERVHAGAVQLSILSLDVDNMKVVNDRHGHAVGDKVLEEIGHVLAAETDGQHLAARIGGDEFCLALDGVGYDGASETAQRILTRIAAIDVDGGQTIVRASVGIAEADSRDVDIAALIARVDALLYEAKKPTTDQ